MDMQMLIDELLPVKSDSSLLFKKLNELHTEHRIIMTGVRSTPSCVFECFLTILFRRR